jgi:hypothetical protein
VTNLATQIRKPYTTPQFERYGNVRDLTQAQSTSKQLDAGILPKATNRTH